MRGRQEVEGRGEGELVGIKSISESFSVCI